ncbi:phosphatidylinositol N-acetylglucosaminyltransferase subunit H-like [Gigantopelta aegis]|uniref:phosphatidylinositol N-acetylglucosaminyltransferase subunit H-like n=1 Tax=Gigantopelta aegis TaxID=1735272 RepID=UPI001B88B25A|nr:phosphatidylinositol N-acetylglucosaminyltransferase subunit H-like [Gigantopelta aegis]
MPRHDFVHKNYGNMGSEFIIHHRTVQVGRLIVMFVLSVFFASLVKLHLKEMKILWSISGFLAFMLIYRLYNKVKRESFLVLPSLGIQVKTEYLFGHCDAEFIDILHVKDVIINEAITMQRVICYLAVLLKEDNCDNLKAIYPLFTHSWPSLSVIQPIYQITQKKLFAEHLKSR